MVGKHHWYKQLRGADLTPTEGWVLVILSTYADAPNPAAPAEMSNAWPSRATLAAAAGLSEDTVKRVLRRLRQKGWLIVDEPGGNQYRHGATTSYTLTNPKGCSIAPLKGCSSAPLKGGSSAPQPGPNTPGPFDHSETDVSGPTHEPDLGADVIIDGQTYGWSDLSADFDLLRQWLIEQLDITEAEESTGRGMWQQSRHPYEIRNTIAKRRDETESSEAVG